MCKTEVSNFLLILRNNFCFKTKEKCKYLQITVVQNTINIHIGNSNYVNNFLGINDVVLRLRIRQHLCVRKLIVVILTKYFKAVSVKKALVNRCRYRLSDNYLVLFKKFCNKLNSTYSPFYFALCNLDQSPSDDIALNAFWLIKTQNA